MTAFAFLSIDLSTVPVWVLVIVGLFAILGLLGALFVASILAFDEYDGSSRFGPQMTFESGVDRGAAIPDFVNEDALRGLATHHRIEGPPSAVEKSRTTGFSINPLNWFGGKHERGTTETRHPGEDMGELIRRLLRRLEDEGELNHVDRIYIDHLIGSSIPMFGDPNLARESLNRWFAENYPGGFDGASTAEVAEKLSKIGTEIPEAALRERLEASFASVKNAQEEPVLFLEGEWMVEGEAGKLVLTRTDVRVGGYEEPARSVRLPDGASMKVQLEGELTKHGNNRIVGLDRPVRASVMATVRQCDPGSCSIELTPIAIFQRIGSN